MTSHRLPLDRLARLLRIGTPRLLTPQEGYALWAETYPPWAHNPVMQTEEAVVAPILRAAQPNRALDVGTGSGVQALLAARHARRVVATDVNKRALLYAELNAALNGLENIEFRRGSLFEPAGGEYFDLVTCNAPYVVSPENRWAYRS